jgi:hypothetical protein
MPPKSNPNAGPQQPQRPIDNPFSGVAGPISLLILAPEAFMQALAPLVQHKNNTGMSALAVSVESLSTSFVGADSPEQIKRAIQYAHEKLKTKYVMLVGDAQSFPVRYFFLQSTIYYPNTTVPIPCDAPGDFVQSDLYYASLYHHTGTYPHVKTGAFDNWDKNGDGLYNESSITGTATPVQQGPTYNPDNVDGYPDLSVGRVPAGTVQNVVDFVNKIINYETTISFTRHESLTFTLVADAIYDAGAGRTTGLANNSGLAAKAPAANTNYLLFNGETPVANYTKVTASQLAAQAGQSIWVSYIGHGWYGEWDNFGDSDVQGTQNLTGLPVVFAAACKSGSFTIMPPWDFNDNNTYTDVTGTVRGPLTVLSNAAPNESGPVVRDESTGAVWGNGPGCLPLPVNIPRPNPVNSPNAYNVQSFANSWLFNYAPGGGIAYFGEHCVTDDGPATELETTMLTNYLDQIETGQSNPVLGDLYLSAQQAFYGNHVNDANVPNQSDYHSIPRLYLGWMIFHGDPSLRLPVWATSPIKYGPPPHLQNPVTITGFGGTIIDRIPGDGGTPVTYGQTGVDESPRGPRGD